MASWNSFLDPDSRVRLPEDLSSPQVRHLAKISWTGGFVDGVSLPLNQSLNVLIGPRGAGKSTVLESIRYVLDLEPIGSDAKTAHDGFVKNVLGSGTKVVVEVDDPESSSTWMIERPVPGETVVTKDGSRSCKPHFSCWDCRVLWPTRGCRVSQDARSQGQFAGAVCKVVVTKEKRQLKSSDDLATNRQAILDEISKIDGDPDAKIVCPLSRNSWIRVRQGWRQGRPQVGGSV